MSCVERTHLIHYLHELTRCGVQTPVLVDFIGRTRFPTNHGVSLQWETVLVTEDGLELRLQSLRQC
jgi:hypothetical protein